MVRRGLTNTPLQALDLMNDVAFLEAARVLAERMMKEGGATPADRLAFAFRLATGRRPVRDGKPDSLGCVRLRKRRVSMHVRKRRQSCLTSENHPRDATLDVKELAAYTTSPARS